MAKNEMGKGVPKITDRPASKRNKPEMGSKAPGKPSKSPMTGTKGMGKKPKL